MNLTERMREDWDRRALEDAYYYVAFAERAQSRDAFLATAAQNLSVFEVELSRLQPSTGNRRALEIGCGPGRLMLPLSRHFDEIHGVDISGEMIKLAREVLAGTPHAAVHQTQGADLSLFQDRYFDFVYSYAVFQHIPSRDIVLQYLRAIVRVLKPGGSSCFHLRGAAPLPSEIASQAPTWTGCYFDWSDVQQFVRESNVQLVFIQGIDTQHMMLTIRKAEQPSLAPADGPVVLGVTPATGSGSSVAQSGKEAIVALWLDHLPANVSLLDFEVRFNGVRGFPYYVTPKIGQSGYQVNVVLPKEVSAGDTRIDVLFRESVVAGAAHIEVAPNSAPGPRVLHVADGVDRGHAEIRSGAVKVSIENVPDPKDVLFVVDDGLAVRELEFTAVDLIASTYEFGFLLPSLPAGTHRLVVRTGPVELPALQLHVS